MIQHAVHERQEVAVLLFYTPPSSDRIKSHASPRWSVCCVSCWSTTIGRHGDRKAERAIEQRKRMRLSSAVESLFCIRVCLSTSEGRSVEQPLVRHRSLHCQERTGSCSRPSLRNCSRGPILTVPDFASCGAGPRLFSQATALKEGPFLSPPHVPKLPTHSRRSSTKPYL